MYCIHLREGACISMGGCMYIYGRVHVLYLWEGACISMGGYMYSQLPASEDTCESKDLRK